MLSSSVLVLNRYFQPVHVTTARRAFVLLYAGAARVIGEDYRTFDFESWAALGASAGRDIVRTASRAIGVPRVIMLQVFDRLPRSSVRFSRLNIFLRDDDTCQYCGRKRARSELNLDHVLPRARGGRTTWENVVCCCIDCNLRKGCRSPAEAGLSLRRPPRRPTWSPVFRALGTQAVRREWLPFLNLVDASYWHVELRDGD